MNSSQIENLCQLTAHLTARLGVPLWRDAIEIHKLARHLTRYAEKDCNVGLNDSDKRTVDRLEKRIAELLQACGLKANFSGDPRGYVVKVQGLPGNTWGGDSEGFGVG